MGNAARVEQEDRVTLGCRSRVEALDAFKNVVRCHWRRAKSWLSRCFLGLQLLNSRLTLESSAASHAPRPVFATVHRELSAIHAAGVRGCQWPPVSDPPRHQDFPGRHAGGRGQWPLFESHIGVAGSLGHAGVGAMLENGSHPSLSGPSSVR
jgi:hypothetical protein